jgi:hypothetical protein
MVKQLHTVEEVISELGGPDSVKELTRRASPSAVPTWKWRKKFPATTYAVMRSALQERGLSAPNDLWGMP